MTWRAYADNFRIMKKIILVLFIVFLFAHASAALMRATSVDGVKLRSGPGDDYEILFDYSQNMPLQVVDKDAYWTKVRDWQGMTGWVESSLLDNRNMRVVRKINVNLRGGPGTRYAVVNKVLKGTVLEVLKVKKSWLSVKVVDPPTDETGWIRSDMVWGY